MASERFKFYHSYGPALILALSTHQSKTYGQYNEISNSENMIVGLISN